MYVLHDSKATIVIGPTNNFFRIHGIKFRNRHKRYKHEPKWIPKRARIRYHTMKNVGCDDYLIYKYLVHDLNDTRLANRIINAYAKEGVKNG